MENLGNNIIYLSMKCNVGRKNTARQSKMYKSREQMTSSQLNVKHIDNLPTNVRMYIRILYQSMAHTNLTSSMCIVF